MGFIDDDMIGRAGRFLWTSGRVLEQRMFAFLFGGEARPEGVLAALNALDEAAALARELPNLRGLLHADEGPVRGAPHTEADRDRLRRVLRVCRAIPSCSNSPTPPPPTGTCWTRNSPQRRPLPTDSSSRRSSATAPQPSEQASSWMP